MKGLHAGFTVLWLTCAASAHAQQPPEMPKADLYGSLGWLNAHKPGLNDYNDWYNRSLNAAATFGWYWTEQIKTEVEGAVSSKAELYAQREIVQNGQRFYTSSEYIFSTRRITVSQQYQFGHNALFHPHLAAGIDTTWERVRVSDEETYFYDPITRVSRLVRIPPPPPRTDVRVRPFAEAGFKAYLSSRAFFRSDLRFVLAREARLDEVLLRFGIGVDF